MTGVPSIQVNWPDMPNQPSQIAPPNKNDTFFHIFQKWIFFPYPNPHPPW